MDLKYGIAGCPFIPIDNIKRGGRARNIIMPALIKKSTFPIYKKNPTIETIHIMGSSMLYSIIPRNLAEYL